VDEWNFMSPRSREDLLGVIGRAAARFFDLVSRPALWDAPTAAGHWQLQIGHVSADGLTFEAGNADEAPVSADFDAATVVLTSYGRFSAGTWHGDPAPADRFQNLSFRI